VFGTITMGVSTGCLLLFNKQWLQEPNLERILIGFVGGWGGWYVLKIIKYKRI